ncbi:hypothetical protein [Acinetobacter sp. Ver3]|nr:hypothetical protein [Acinetobacter sp. Ver3]
MKVILMVVVSLVVIALMNKYKTPRVIKNIVAIVFGVVVGTNLSEF